MKDGIRNWGNLILDRRVKPGDDGGVRLGDDDYGGMESILVWIAQSSWAMTREVGR